MGYTTRDGVSADGRHTVVLEATGDGASDLSTEMAQNALIDTELCAAGGSSGTWVGGVRGRAGAAPGLRYNCRGPAQG